VSIFKPVGHAAAQFQEQGALTQPPPTLECAGAYIPAKRQIILIQMPRSHSDLLRLPSNREGTLPDQVEGAGKEEGRRNGRRASKNEKSRLKGGFRIGEERGSELNPAVSGLFFYEFVPIRIFAEGSSHGVGLATRSSIFQHLGGPTHRIVPIICFHQDFQNLADGVSI
jgi:hypothetical protein